MFFFFCTESKMTENSVDKVYIRAADVCSSPSPSLYFYHYLSFSLLCARSFFRVLAEMSRDRALLTLLSRTSPLRGRFTKEYLAHEELVPATGGTSNEHAPELCDAFNFIYIAVEYSSFRRCVQNIIFTTLTMLPIYARDEMSSSPAALLPLDW